MGKNKRIILIGVIAVIVLANAVAGAIVLTDSDSKQEVFAGETIGKNSFANPVFDLTLEDLKNAGCAEGDTFDIEIKGTIVHDATLTH